jgi:glycosyltransferase involved in cell wall biosynthesis
MRFIVVSTATIPGYSGGWSTPLDLFGGEHRAMYVISSCPPGFHRMENVPYLGLGIPGRRYRSSFLERARDKVYRELMPRAVKLSFRRFGADIALCLDEPAGFAALRTGLPYAMRFHQRVHPSTDPAALKKLIDRALFATASESAEVPWTVTIPHCEDISRYSFAPARKPRRALLLTVLNDEHRPEDFIRGVMGSRAMTGDIVGTGPLRDRILRMCRDTGGRVRLLPPIPRLGLSELSGRYQVGVATLAPRERPLYQMKIVTYMAMGMHVIASTWSDTVNVAPRLLHGFTTPEDLSRALDETEESWERLEPRRRAALEWVTSNYSIERPRRIFSELLRASLPGSAAST